MTRMCRILIAVVLLLCIPVAACAAPTEAEAYQRMIALRGEFYEGRSWTNANYYGWSGGYFSGGYGCAGFAFRLSDEAFDGYRAKVSEEIDYDSLRVGDILRINDDTHSVVIMEKHSSYVVIAEGNYNSSIHWGRTLNKSKVESSDYVMTRYPSNADPTSGACGVAAEWSYADGVLNITGSGALWNFKSVFGNGRLDAPWAPFAGSITTVNVDSGITGIGYGSFADCSGLADVYFDGTAAQWEQVGIDSANDPLLAAAIHTAEQTFDNLATVNLPAGLTVIEKEAFMGTDVEKVVIPDGCQQIQSRAFANCSSLQVIYLPSTTQVAEDAFEGSGNVTVIYTDQ
ncbi:MAG: leucine-rich repeat domain-containing protein [Clostridia bacterium]|nr:leucine-rich repeat domain-containing protein [Clostridia bacterium]